MYPPIHAFLGCDTVSRVHSIGKGEESTKKIMSNEEIQEYFFVFNEENADKKSIATAGDKLLCLFYGESSEDNLNQLRYRSFCRRVSTSSIAITPESFPPRSDASKFHSYRAYHQVQVWRGREDIDPLLWGWKIDKSKLMPIAMNQSPAPELLKIVRCTCKTGCKNSRCSCFKHGLKCTNVCGECRGVSCLNCQEITLEVDDEEDDDYIISCVMSITNQL